MNESPIYCKCSLAHADEEHEIQRENILLGIARLKIIATQRLAWIAGGETA